jgi:hypothetical protein
MGLWEDEEAPKCPENRPKLILRVKRTLRQWKVNNPPFGNRQSGKMETAIPAKRKPLFRKN